MGKSLAEYAAESGKQEQPAADRQIMEATAADAKERAAQIMEAAALKESIAQQLEQGNEPQYILYTALKCIGILSNDATWAAAGEAQLDKIYSDLAQRSFITDNEAIAEKRLQEKTAAYNERLRRQLQRQLNGYQRIAKEISGALTALDELEQITPAAQE